MDQAEAPEYLARLRTLRAGDLRRRLLAWPQLIASYELLAAIARSRHSQADVIAWERPCQRSVGTERRRPPSLHTGGHGICTLAASKSAQRKGLVSVKTSL
jgi:hypothetical protein